MMNNKASIPPKLAKELKILKRYKNIFAISGNISSGKSFISQKIQKQHSIPIKLYNCDKIVEQYYFNKNINKQEFKLKLLKSTHNTQKKILRTLENNIYEYIIKKLINYAKHNIKNTNIITIIEIPLLYEKSFYLGFNKSNRISISTPIWKRKSLFKKREGILLINIFNTFNKLQIDTVKTKKYSGNTIYNSPSISRRICNFNSSKD